MTKQQLNELVNDMEKSTNDLRKYSKEHKRFEICQELAKWTVYTKILEFEKANMTENQKNKVSKCMIDIVVYSTLAID